MYLNTASVVARSIVRAYQLGISPWLAPSCRFVPSCSEYAIEAYARHSFSKATWLTTRRLCKCNPWGPHGFDPVPPVAENVATKIAVDVSTARFSDTQFSYPTSTSSSSKDF